MPAILFGSMSTLVDTSEMQREAFNQAFDAHGLDWDWQQDDYATLLENSGGRDRITAYAESRGEQVHADAVHLTKTELFQERLAAGPLTPRPGVVDMIESARRDGQRVGLVTTTARGNVTALAAGLRGVVDVDGFDVVLDNSQVENPKPSPAAYASAMARLGLRAQDCVAVEDNLGGVRSAASAGIRCIAFPNANTVAHDFARATSRVDALDYSALLNLTHRS